MNNAFLLFLITTIPAGVVVIYYIIKRKKINQIMKRENPKYTGHPNNIVDLFRVIKAVNSPEGINQSEKKFLIKLLLLLGISYITLIIWLFIFIFYSDSLLK